MKKTFHSNYEVDGRIEKQVAKVVDEVALTISSVSDGGAGSVIVQHADAELGDAVLLTPAKVLAAGVSLYAVAGRQATAQAGAAGTITLDSGASATDDAYNGLAVEIVDGTGEGQVREIDDYTGSTKVASVSEDWGTNPDDTSVFRIDGFLEARLLNNSGSAVALSAVDAKVQILKA